MPHYSVSYFNKSVGVKLGYSILGREFIGKVRPLVLINGMSCTLDDWKTLSDELAKNRPILVYDHRGVASSRFMSGMQETNVSLMVEDMLDLLDHLGWTEADMLGFSMGGVIAQQLLVEPRYHTRISIPHIILAATCGGTPRTDPDGMAEFMRLMTAADLFDGDRTSAKYKESIKQHMGIFFDPELCRARPAVVETWVDGFAEGNRPVAVATAQAASGMHLDFNQKTHLFPKGINLLVIHGTADTLILCGESAAYSSLSQSRTLRVGQGRGEVPDLAFGHIWWEYFTPQTWCSAIEDFLATPNNKNVVEKAAK